MNNVKDRGVDGFIWLYGFDFLYVVYYINSN